MMQDRAMSPKKILDDDGNDLACQIAMEDALHDVLNRHLDAGWDRDEVATAAMELVNAWYLGRVADRGGLSLLSNPGRDSRR
jgi:hypothetical protein